jgi:hypothetical protein
MYNCDFWGIHAANQYRFGFGIWRVDIPSIYLQYTFNITRSLRFWAPIFIMVAPTNRSVAKKVEQSLGKSHEQQRHMGH